MNKKKLSKAQLNALRHLRDNNTFLHYMPYMGRFNPTSYFFANKTLKHFRFDTINTLIHVGYLRNEGGDIGYSHGVKCYLTQSAIDLLNS